MSVEGTLLGGWLKGKQKKNTNHFVRGVPYIGTQHSLKKSNGLDNLPFAEGQIIFGAFRASFLLVLNIRPFGEPRSLWGQGRVP